ncbi:MAG: MlaD family protein [Bacteroidota bacterium]
MKASPTQKMKIGVFAVSGIVLLLLGMFLIGSRKNMFGKQFTVYGTFRNVGGLQPGNTVRFNGISIGTVESIDITDDSTIKVGMSIQKKVQRYLKQDAIASIGSDGLMGDKLVVIAPGAGGAPPLANGGYVQTKNPIDFDKTLAKFNSVVDNATTITSSMANISTQITSGKGSIGRLIYDDKLERGLEKTVGAAQQTMVEAQRTVRAVHSTVESAHETIDSARVTLKSARKGVEGFSENMEAMQHSFLLKGFFKKKQRAIAERAAHAEDSARNEQRKDKKEARKTKRMIRRAEKNGDVTPPLTGL